MAIHHNIKSENNAMPAIRRSSMMVIVLIGKLNTAPRHAQRIFLLFKTL
jgi:hypothetical protein